MNKAVFLDRDGTLIKQKHFLKDPEEVEMENRAIPALRLLQKESFLIVIVSNQSGIGRGLITEEEYESVENKVDAILVDNDIKITASFFCPHHPTEAKNEYLIDCDCRKPKPGMLLTAIEQFDIDVENSFMIGDKVSDVEAGKNAGVKSILVRTGYGSESIDSLNDIKPDYIAEDLYDAVVNFICQ